MSTLLDAAFVRELETLRRRLEIRARSGRAGEHLSRRRGGAAEFHEHRPYTAGDDLRRMDWAAYARSGTPVLKVFRAEEDIVVRLLCDSSASMQLGEPDKLSVARRLAAAMGYMALASSERAQLLVTAGGALHCEPPRRGRGGIPALLRSLDRIEASGTTALAGSVAKTMARCRRPGMLAVISDFFDPGPVLASLSRAVQAGHDVALVQVLSPEEVFPSYEGDWALEDIETGELLEMTMDAQALDAYRGRLLGLFEELSQWARSRRASYVRVQTDEPLVQAVRRIVARSVDG